MSSLTPVTEEHWVNSRPRQAFYHLVDSYKFQQDSKHIDLTLDASYESDSCSLEV